MTETEKEKLNTQEALAEELNEAPPPSEGGETPAAEEQSDAVQTERSKEGKGTDAQADDVLKNFEGRTVQAPKKRKYGWVGNIVLLAVIGLSIWMMLEIVLSSGAEAKSLGQILSESDWRFALALLAVVLGVMICDCAKYAVILKTTTGRIHLKESVKVSFLGKFYDNVTPFAAGGQPMQIYYLHKKGFSGGISSAVILIRYFAQMFCWVLVSVLFMACNTGVLNSLTDPAYKTVLIVAGWIGVAVNAALPLFVVMFALMPKFARALVGFFVNIGHKLKIVKDKEKTMGKAEAVVSDFRAGFVIMARKPFQFIMLVLLCLIEVTLTFSVPYFAMRTLAPVAPAWNDGFTAYILVTALNVYVTQSVAVIPTPGNTGAMEGVGALAFAAIVTGSVQFWAMFLWRFSIYYVYLIIGLGLTVADFIRRLVRARKLKKEAAQGENNEGA